MNRFTGACHLHELFAEQARQNPEAIAAVFEGEHLTYAALDEHATRLAYTLQGAGVRADMAVGLCAERSLLLLIGLLGILKAGGAYVPLDPTYPQLWLKQVIEQAGLSLLLTQESLRQQLRHAPVKLLCIEECQQEHIGVAQLPPILCSPQQLAYVIYTSGSTGQPKGVAMTHQALVNMVLWQQEHSAMGLHSRTLQFTSLSFDVSCQELFATWSTGGCLILIDQQQRQDPQQLLRHLCVQSIERLFLPFIALQQVAQVAQEYSEPLPQTLREVFTAGEQLKISRPLRAFFNALPQCHLDNHYGPSETHLVTAYRLPGEPGTWPALPPIGMPISNCEAYVLNEHLQPVPIGEIGELYLGGIALARGYWRRADLTAERFLPHLFSTALGTRLYRTGDLARTQRDGTLEFVGRQDEQIKIRGYRIEPLEIEAVIGTHPAVNAVAVGVQEIIGEGEIAEKRLVAYIVRKTELPLSLKGLRSFVGERLPHYMLPTRLVELECLPLSPSGKVKRRQLPTLAAEEAGEVRDNSNAAQRELEDLVLQTWQQVLQMKQVGIHDNFFEIGGDSLLATQVISRLRRLAGVELPIQAIFEAPTIEQLALRLIQMSQKDHMLEVPAIMPAPRNQDLPLSFTQQRLWFLHQLEPDSTAYSIPIVLRLSGRLDRAALASALAAVIERHENLRTTFPAQGSHLRQVIAPEPTTALHLLDLSYLAPLMREAVARRLVEQEIKQPFDLARGPLLRCRLLQLVEHTDHMLLLTMHHIISDGWSMNILMRELTLLYTAFSQNQAATLPPLPIQYADYALWQRSWLQGEILEQHLNYWKRQLAGMLPLKLPGDYPRPSAPTFRGARFHLSLPHELHQRLRRLSQREGATLFMTLLAAFQVLLMRCCGQEDIAVGTTIANRNHEETEQLIGCFLNTLVLRTSLQDHPGFTHLLHRVREVVLGAYAYQELPFEMLIEHLRLPRENNHMPLVNVLFVLQNVPREGGELPGISVKPVEGEATHARFDLALFFTENASDLHCSVNYSLDLFKLETIAALMQRYQALLNSLVNQPHTKITSLDISTTDERAQETQQQAALHQKLKASRGQRQRISAEDIAVSNSD